MSLARAANANADGDALKERNKNPKLLRKKK
jgi:hypothetical protein